MCVFTGHIHHGVYVFWLVETVPKSYQAQREENFADRVETMVHANPISPKVCATALDAPILLVLGSYYFEFFFSFCSHFSFLLHVIIYNYIV